VKKPEYPLDRKIDVPLPSWAADAIETLAPRFGQKEAAFARALICSGLSSTFGVPIPPRETEA
jgi:hypothetical protein